MIMINMVFNVKGIRVQGFEVMALIQDRNIMYNT